MASSSPRPRAVGQQSTEPDEIDLKVMPALWFIAGLRSHSSQLASLSWQPLPFGCTGK